MAAPTRRRYTDEDRVRVLAVLKSNAGNLSGTSRETGVPINTIRRWRDEFNPELTDLRQEAEESLATLWERVARAYLGHAMTEKVIEDSSGNTAVSIAATATEKKQLLTGQPTEINRHEHNERATPDRALDAAATALRRSGIVN